MCLAIPMQITAINGSMAQCVRHGIVRNVDIYLLQGLTVEVGDFVLVHVGYAIQIVEAGEAKSRWRLYDEMQNATVNDHA